MVLNIAELRELVAPIAAKYGLTAVYLFGSYARGEATSESDVDIMIDRAGSKIKGLFDMGGLYEELRSSIGKEVDLITLQSLQQESAKRRTPDFIQEVQACMIKIY